MMAQDDVKILAYGTAISKNVVQILVNRMLPEAGAYNLDKIAM